MEGCQTQIKGSDFFMKNFKKVYENIMGFIWET
jgi:hypothetical protein